MFDKLAVQKSLHELNLLLICAVSHVSLGLCFYSLRVGERVHMGTCVSQ